MARHMILGGLEWRLPDNQDLDDLETNLRTAMENSACYTVVLADGQRLLVNGARAEYALLWDNVPQPAPLPVAEVGSRIHG